MHCKTSNDLAQKLICTSYLDEDPLSKLTMPKMQETRKDVKQFE
jgi:hypothetical protein